MKKTKTNYIYLKRELNDNKDIFNYNINIEQILCTFARSTENAKTKYNGRIHLITSAYKCQEDQILDLNVGSKRIEGYSELGLLGLDQGDPIVVYKIYNIPRGSSFNSLEEFITFYNKNNNTYTIKEINNNLYVFYGSIITVLLDILNNPADRLFTRVFGSNNHYDYKDSSGLNKSLFVFEGFNHFFMIKAILSLFNIDISGGGIPNRICLSPVHANLMSFLFLFDLYRFFDNKDVYASFLDISTTRSIESTFYKYPKITNFIELLDNNRINPGMSDLLSYSWKQELTIYLYILVMYILKYSREQVKNLNNEIDKLTSSATRLSTTAETKKNLEVDNLNKTKLIYSNLIIRLENIKISNDDLIKVVKEFITLHSNLLSDINKPTEHLDFYRQSKENLLAFEKLYKVLNKPSKKNKFNNSYSFNKRLFSTSV
jgi:hypothetical protein